MDDLQQITAETIRKAAYREGYSAGQHAAQAMTLVLVTRMLLCMAFMAIMQGLILALSHYQHTH